MKITKALPPSGTTRTRRVFAFLPEWFEHGSNDKPLRTMVWFSYYLVDECYDYGIWRHRGKRLE